MRVSAHKCYEERTEKQCKQDEKAAQNQRPSRGHALSLHRRVARPARRTSNVQTPQEHPPAVVRQNDKGNDASEDELGHCQPAPQRYTG